MKHVIKYFYSFDFAVGPRIQYNLKVYHFYAISYSNEGLTINFLYMTYSVDFSLAIF